VRTKLLVNWRNRRWKINAIISLLEVVIKEKKWKFSPDFIWNINNNDLIEELYLWRKYENESKGKRPRLKEFLLGRKIIYNINENEHGQMIGSAGGMKRTVDCKMKCDLEYERWRKFRFKFKRNGQV
jgi:hypothetical protein